MVRIPHSRLDALIFLIKTKSYIPDTTDYHPFLLAKEHDSKNREHFHGITFCTNKQYDEIQRAFRSLWQLKGQAKLGGLKEYGRVRNIKNKNRMLQYTCKEKNIYTSPNWKIDLKQYINKSFNKIKGETNKDLREKELKDILIRYHVEHPQDYITSRNIRDMVDSEFSSYQYLCEQICKTYQKYHYDFPVLKTVNRLLVRYGIMNVDEAISDHLGRWFNVRDKLSDPIDFQHQILDQVLNTLGTLENYYIYK